MRMDVSFAACLPASEGVPRRGPFRAQIFAHVQGAGHAVATGTGTALMNIVSNKLTYKVTYKNLSGDATLGPVLPATDCGSGARATSITYSQVAPIDPIIHNGLSVSFTFPLDSNAGTCLAPVSGTN